MPTNPQMKQLYIEGASITDIATTLNINRSTIYYHKNKDAQRNIDWDELRYAYSTNHQVTEQNEKLFLSTIIKAFEKEIDNIEHIEDTEKRLSILAKYANLYYKIKQPMTGDSTSHRLSAAIDTIYALGELARQKGNNEVVRFLSANNEPILSALNEVKKRL